MMIPVVDPALWKAFQLGIVLGGVILSTLLLFPGRHPRNDEDKDGDETTAPEKSSAAAAAATDEPIGASSFTKNADGARRRQARENSSHHNHTDNGGVNEDGYWTPHRRLNAGVYVILIATAIFFVVQSYTAHPDGSDSKTDPSSLLGMLFRTYFPREAAVVRGA